MNGAEVRLEAGGVIHLTIGGTLELADVRRYLDTMSAQLQVGRPVALLTTYPGTKPKKDKAGHAAEREWMKAHRPLVRRHLVAVALVHEMGPVRQLIERVTLSGAASRLFGCPCRPFADPAEARNWLDERLGRAATAT